MESKTNHLEQPPQSSQFDYWLTGFFLAKRAEGCSPKTTEDYRNDLRHLTRWCTAQGEGNLDKLTSADLKRFLAELRDQPNGRGKSLSPKTVRNTWVALRSFYRWLAEENGGLNPGLGVPAPKAPQPVIEPLSREEVSAVLKACEATRPAKTVARRTFVMQRCEALRDKAIVLVLLDSGLRAGELCALANGDIDMETGKVVVRLGKGGKGRIAYLGKVARRSLWRYLRKRGTLGHDDPIFVTRNECRLTPEELAKHFGRLGERAGVAHLHPHRLRHSFATEFLRNGGNLLGLQRLLGHTSLEMVRRYAAIVDTDLARAHETGSPADKWRL